MINLHTRYMTITSRPIYEKNSEQRNGRLFGTWYMETVEKLNRLMMAHFI